MSQQPRSASHTRPPTTTTTTRTRSRSPTCRPTTPLRPSSRSSFHASLRNSQSHGGQQDSSSWSSSTTPLDALEPQFAELSDSMADLEANFMHLQLMHESLSRFSENFAAFLYGLNMNAFATDFPEAPIADSIKRFQQYQRQRDAYDASVSSSVLNRTATATDGETTFMSVAAADTSFASVKPTPKRKTVGVPTTPGTSATNKSASSNISSTRGSYTSRYARGSAGTGTGTGRGASRGTGLPRGRGRGVK